MLYPSAARAPEPPGADKNLHARTSFPGRRGAGRAGLRQVKAREHGNRSGQHRATNAPQVAKQATPSKCQVSDSGGLYRTSHSEKNICIETKRQRTGPQPTTHKRARTHTHTHFVTVIKRTQPTVDRRQAGTDQNDSSGHNHKIVMEARRLSERYRDRTHTNTHTGEGIARGLSLKSV